jgi:hypothetical protein
MIKCTLPNCYPVSLDNELVFENFRSKIISSDERERRQAREDLKEYATNNKLILKNQVERLKGSESAVRAQVVAQKIADREALKDESKIPKDESKILKDESTIPSPTIPSSDSNLKNDSPTIKNQDDISLKEAKTISLDVNTLIYVGIAAFILIIIIIFMIKKKNN